MRVNLIPLSLLSLAVAFFMAYLVSQATIGHTTPITLPTTHSAVPVLEWPTITGSGPISFEHVQIRSN